MRSGLALACVLLAACTPQRQPVAVAVSTATPTPSPTPAAPLRYGLGASLRPLNLTADAVRAIAIVDQLTTDDAPGYDIILSLLPQPSFTPSSQPLKLGFVLTNLPPLDQPTLRAQMQTLLPQLPLPGLISPDSAAFDRIAEATRTALLAAGQPDGVRLVLAYEVSLWMDVIGPSLARANVELDAYPITPAQRLVALDRQLAHLYWGLLRPSAIAQWQASQPDVDVIPSGDLWLHYKLAGGVSVLGYTDEGLPLIGRQ